MVRSEKTRQFIIEKTASIFNKKGYTGTYLSDLTEATGLTKGSIYGNFKDKNEVAVEAFRYNYECIASQIRERIVSKSNTVDRMQVFVDFYREKYLEIFESGGCPLLNTAIDADDGNPDLRAEVEKAVQRWKGKVIEIVDYGIANDEIKVIDATSFANRLMATIEGSIMITRMLNDGKVMRDNLDKLEEEIKLLKR